MTTKKDETGGDATSPLLETIDPRQVAANDLTSTPNEEDNRDPGPQPDPKDNPAAPDDESNVVDPSDPMTLTGKDAAPGSPGGTTTKTSPKKD